MIEHTPGYRAIEKWSLKIHGDDGDRHAWALEVARLFDEGYEWWRGDDAEFPRFPSRFKDTHDSRMETAARLYHNAKEEEQRGLFG